MPCVAVAVFACMFGLCGGVRAFRFSLFPTASWVVHSVSAPDSPELSSGALSADCAVGEDEFECKLVADLSAFLRLVVLGLRERINPPVRVLSTKQLQFRADFTDTTHLAFSAASSGSVRTLVTIFGRWSKRSRDVRSRGIALGTRGNVFSGF